MVLFISDKNRGGWIRTGSHFHAKKSFVVASEIVTVTVTWKSVPNRTETGPTPTHVQAKFKGTVPIPKQHELEAKLGTTNTLEWVHTTNKHQSDLLCACMHRNQDC